MAACGTENRRMKNSFLKITITAISSILLSVIPVSHISADEITQAASVIIRQEEGYAGITAPQGHRIGYVYIEWNVPPVSRTVTTLVPHETVTLSDENEYGFVNDLIVLEIPALSVNVTWDNKDKGVTISRISVFSQGDLPPNIQQWEPPLEKADMLLISTHADDEHLYFGGAMPVYAGEKGKSVQVAYFVDHGILRTRELLAGLWEVGIRNYPLISDFPDQYVASYDAAERFYGLDNALGFQVMLLRRFKPEVVLGHDLDGEYGHGAHMLNARSLSMALELASDESKYPESAGLYGIWNVKKCYLHLYENNEIIMDWTIPLEHFGGRSGWDMAKAGYAHHISQHHFKFRVRIEGPNDCRRFGLFRSTVGPDITKDDFFENIPVAAITIQPTTAPTFPVSPSQEPTVTSDSDASSDPDAGPGKNNVSKEMTVILIFAGAVALSAIMTVRMRDRINKARRKRRK